MSLAGTRVFIVEDEALILFSLQDMLADLGCEVVASALRIDDALAQVGELAFDIAILDVNLDGEEVFPVADLLVKRGLPFVFVTGYGEGSLPDAYRAHPALQKPFQSEQLKSTLAELLAAEA